jgi:hypothetical protein
MPPHFPCKEHSDFKAARQRRKHVNMLLLDGCDEYHRTYDTDGWPRHPLQLPLQPRTLTATKPAVATEPLAKAEPPAVNGCASGAGDSSAAGPGASSALERAGTSQRKWAAAYADGGQEAADLAKQVGNVRSPTGTFFALTKPGRLRTPAATGALASACARLAEMCTPALRRCAPGRLWHARVESYIACTFCCKFAMQGLD